MKRPPKSFVVEHKRRTRSATDAPVSIWSGSAGRTMRSLVEANDLEEAAPEQRTSRPSEPASAAPVARARILEARAEPIAIAEPEILEVSAPPPRPRGRPRKAGTAAAAPKPAPASTAPRDWSREIWMQDAEPDTDETPAALAAHDTVVTHEVPAAPDDPMAETAAETASETGPKRPKPSFRERRLEARKKLPLGQRWKWTLKV
ncbi:MULTISPECIES: hypothetical protein [unclassified Aureimonas]|uniref:hypothetical protein n=1 Tax=unclassified Aureimonas TaxID=2615206 RepID=UPI0006F6EC6A|nr:MULTISPECIES: hypothetical protein [unclassified Aureimonas]KQT68919.1 hypothetical protein ASG54_04440 [Aureimonas sp. Leaf460]KQT69146.1 hypothetical protein ASG62_17045 [Aureimonas sp. Leaf427]